MIAALGGDGRIEIETADQRGSIVVAAGITRVNLALKHIVSRQALEAALQRRMELV